MYVIGLEIDILIPHSFSLKDKRRVVTSITERMGRRYQLSACQKSDDNTYTQATIGFAKISPNYRTAKESLGRLMDRIEEDYDVTITDYRWIETI